MAHQTDDATQTTATAEPRLDDGDDHDFVTLMTQFYRGERGRATSWRTRLDHTTDWAVILAATLLTWAFSDPTRPHYVVLVGIVMVTLFLLIEARRYQVLDVWRSRVRLLEENLFADALDGREPPRPEWRTLLSDDLRRPTVKTPFVEAVHRRLRRVYFPLLVVLLFAWVVQLTVFEDTTMGVVEAARIGRIPGWTVIGLVAGTYVVLSALTVWPLERRAKGRLRADEVADVGWRQ
jgi:uncharacterized membrane protein